MRTKNQSKSGTKRLKEIKPKHWYLVLIKKNELHKIKIRAFIKYTFPSYSGISLFLNNNKDRFKGIFLVPMKGKDLLYYGIKLSDRTRVQVFDKFYDVLNYKYPPERITTQGRKSYRTKTRRQLRDANKLFNQRFY